MNIDALLFQAERDCQPVFAALEENEIKNTRRVLSAFQAEDIATRHFSPTTGYGYDDIGRDKLEAVFARLFGAEAAIVRPAIACGTAALSLCLFGLLLPGDHLLSATGTPYDTMETVIGLSGNAPGNLKEMGISYSQVEMCDDQQKIDVQGVLNAMRPNTKVVLIQRSRGYAWRASLRPEEMKDVIEAVHAARPDVFIMVDNCYGEFITDQEPTHFGADVCVGSLIKNPGGGLAPTGAYLVGTKRAIERIEARLTAPGLGREVGSYAAGGADVNAYAAFPQHGLAEDIIAARAADERPNAGAERRELDGREDRHVPPAFLEVAVGRIELVVFDGYALSVEQRTGADAERNHPVETPGDGVVQLERMQVAVFT